MYNNVCFIINNADFFISHRVNIALELIKQNSEVEICCPKPSKSSKKLLSEHKIKVNLMPLSREKLSFFSLIIAFLHAFSIARQKDKIFHLVTILPIIIYGFPLRIMNHKCVFSISGLGTVFISKDFRYRIIKKIILLIYKYLFSGNNSRIIVQNSDDYLFLLKTLKIKDKNIFLIKGSGVEPNKFPFCNELSDMKYPIILFSARLIKEKGILDLIEASKILLAKNILHEVWVAGSIDIGNPSSLTKNDVENLQKNLKTLNFLGYRSDIYSLLKQCSIVCLPSYREGLPKTLIEAAACGRIIVTTDVPGCREIVIHEKTGLLAKVQSPYDLSEKIEYILNNQEKVENIRREAYKNFLNEYTTEVVVTKHLSVYSSF